MPYTMTKGANHTIEVSAHLDPEAVTRESKDIVRSFRTKARVPGFRPGKAPEAAVRARYAEEIRNELQEHLTNLLWREVFEAEKDFQPLTNPQISNLDFDEDGRFSFTAELEVRPNYEISELDVLELPEVSIGVSEAEIDQELEKVQEEQAVWEPADEETAEDGMLVEADLRGVVDETDDEPYTEDDAQFVLGSDGIPPEVSEALQGAKVGDARVAEKTLPSDLENADRAGKTVRYAITVKALKRKTLPEIDDELATSIGLESIQQLRERISDVLAGQKRADRRGQWRRFILDHLEGDIDVNELPSSLVQSTVNDELNRFAYTMAMRGMATDSDQINWQELSAKAEPKARQEVLDTLVLEQLADRYEIPVPEADVDSYLASEAAQQGIPLAEHKANLASEDKLERIRHAARISATVDEIIRRVGGEVE